MTDRKQPQDQPSETAPLERASGTIDNPIGTGEAQPGDRAERAAELGGPVDIFPTRKRPGLESPLATDDPEA